MSGNFFGDTFFNGGFFGALDTSKTGTGGIDPGGRGTFKPTGLLDRPKRGKQTAVVEDRIEESREIAVAIALESQAEFIEEKLELSASDIDREIGILMHKGMLNDEDETILLLLIAATL